MNNEYALQLPADHDSGAGIPSSERTVQVSSTDENTETAMLREARHYRVEELAKINAQIKQLQEKRGRLHRDIAAFDIILGCDVNIEQIFLGQIEISSQSEDPNHSVGKSSDRKRQQSDGLAKSVAAVVKVLQERGPLHYRDIYEAVVDMGVTVPGKDPAATLLSRFGRDGRIERVSSGTYRLIPDMVLNDDLHPQFQTTNEKTL